MIKSGKSIIDTAIETGFADQSHLTRKFKSKFGITPGTYKKQIS
jgi:AraC-like DNA-binding protein